MEISDFTPHFGMSRMPFTNQIGTEALLETEPIRAGLNKLGMAVQSNSFAVVTGEPGTGKSTFLRKFSSTLPPDDFMVLYVSMSNITPRWLYSVPLSMLGIKPHMYVNDARRQFHEQIEIQLKSYRKKVVMIIDEAHLLAVGYRRYDLLEEIRFLLNGEKYDSGSPLTLVLAGQPELWDTLRLDRCRAITQRIVYVCRTGNLPRDQVGSYIAAHLRWAGVQDLLFSSEAVDHIAGLSEGLPRLINKICLHSLSYAALEKRKTVDITTADRAARNEVVEVMLKEEMKE